MEAYSSWPTNMVKICGQIFRSDFLYTQIAKENRMHVHVNFSKRFQTSDLSLDLRTGGFSLLCVCVKEREREREREGGEREACRWYHIRNRNVTHMDEWWLTYEYVMSHACMSQVFRKNASCHTDGIRNAAIMHELCCLYKWVMSTHIWVMSTYIWVMSTYIWVMSTYIWVMSTYIWVPHMYGVTTAWMRHVTHIDFAQCRPYEWAHSPLRMSHVPHMSLTNESCPTYEPYEWVMSHIWALHIYAMKIK